LHNNDISIDRDAYAAAIVDSSAHKRLIVSGPGTGKTFVFRSALERAAGRGLALTFIKNLAGDLRRDLGEVADSYTFHAYCKALLYGRAAGNPTSPYYFPPIYELFSVDSGYGRREIERRFFELDEEDGVIETCLKLGDYYNAVGHTDSVFRVLRHFQRRPGDIPAFPLIVIDEYQDFNILETTFVSVLAERSPVLIAGNDDQALYAFKRASPSFIRAIANDEQYVRFELPYCSRCTSVIVDASNSLIARATIGGLLKGRLGKPYICYTPGKAIDSQRYPKVIDARCSVDTPRAPYMGRYVAEQIRKIPADDIKESHNKGYPTVLVAEPGWVVDRVYEEVRRQFSQAELKKTDDPQIDILDGYRFLGMDSESNLGWRIIIHFTHPDHAAAIATQGMQDDRPIASLLDIDDVARHLSAATLLRRYRLGELLAGKEFEELAALTSRSLTDIDEFLNKSAAIEADEESHSETDQTKPTILCTSLTSSKGLSAGHVFIVGLNNGQLPQHPNSIADNEICQFLVGLTRTRKQCHVVSCGMFGGQRKDPSVFLDWISASLVRVRVDKQYFAGLPSSPLSFGPASL